MKYNLDDLISQSFEGKEKPTVEFTQSVIQKLQASSPGMRKKNQRMLAAACAGIVVVAGMTALLWQGGISDRSEKWKKPVLQVQKKSQTEIRADGERKQGTLSSAIQEQPVAAEALQESSQVSPRRTAAPGKPDNQLSAISDSRSTSAHRQPVVDEKPSATIKPAESKKPIETVKPAENKKPAETAKPAENKKPAETAKPAESARPTETVKPSEPSTITGKYIQLCSMRKFAASDVTSQMQNVSTWNCLVEEALENAAIYSYRQLQEYQEKTREKFLEFKYTEYITGEDFLPALEKYFEGLKQYDQAFFEKNVLYIHHDYATAGYEYQLHAVNAVEEKNEKMVLNVQIEKSWSVPDGMAVVDVMEHNMFAVQIPRDVAEKCDTVKGQIVKLKGKYGKQY